MDPFLDWLLFNILIDLYKKLSFSCLLAVYGWLNFINNIFFLCVQVNTS